MTPFTGNPLSNFRIPRRLPKLHAPVVGEHFDVKPQDMRQTPSAINIYPNQFRYRDNPQLEIEFALWEDDGSMESRRDYYQKVEINGYQVAMAGAFDIAESRKLTWKKGAGGRLCLWGSGGGKNNPTLVLMWRTGEERDRCNARDLEMSNDVQKSFEEKVQEGTAVLSIGLGKEIAAVVSVDDEEETRILEDEK